MTKLFHYCTVETLKSILLNQTLRLSDIRKSNDSKEIDFLFEEYKKWLLHKNNQSAKFRYNAAILGVNQHIQMENTVFLVLCLSRKEDDLHMWSCYGNKGVSIEFDRDELETYIKRIRVGMTEEQRSEKYTAGSTVLQLRDVEYYGDATKPISVYFNSQNLNQDDDFNLIFTESPFIKSDFFANEDETRIVYTYISGTNIPNNLSLTDDNGNVEETIVFKSTSSSLYQHKMVLDMPININLIKSITIGPNSTLTIQDLEELLFIYGISDVDVRSSKGSYR